MSIALWFALAVLAALVALVAMAAWQRAHPSALPYSQRFFLDLPHPFLGRDRLRSILDPQPGERVLEIGPGTGYYSLGVASWIAPSGSLDLLDIQQEYLDHTIRKAEGGGVSNIVGTRGDAASLPYEDDSFDAAFGVQMLGEVPDQVAALRELHRVLKPTGRLVVGENIFDPHVVPARSLRDRAKGAGFLADGIVGGALGYFARFAPRGRTHASSV